MPSRRQAQARPRHVVIPSAGPTEALCTDVALFGPKHSKSVLLIISGTHGVEGFAGSAIQTGLLRERVVSTLPDGVGVLLIHALNPYGMANGRRFNETNVDINRNFRDHREPHPDNPHYAELAPVINPDTVSFWSEVYAWSRLLCYRAMHGHAALQSAISQGQYSHPDGLFFGGTSDAWSNTTLRSIANHYLTDAERIVVVDIHTGLGEFGDYEIILNDPPEADVFARARAIWGSDRVKSTLPSMSWNAASASAHVTGTLKHGIMAHLPAEVTAVSLEFGTLPPTQVFKALRAENWLHHHGKPSHPKATKIKECLQRAFYPDSEAWKASAWANGRDVIERALSWLKERSES